MVFQHDMIFERIDGLRLVIHGTMTTSDDLYFRDQFLDALNEAEAVGVKSMMLRLGRPHDGNQFAFFTTTGHNTIITVATTTVDTVTMVDTVVMAIAAEAANP